MLLQYSYCISMLNTVNSVITCTCMKDEVKTSKCEKSNIIKSSDVIHKVEQDDEAN